MPLKFVSRSALVNLLKFLASQESHLASNHDIFALAAQAVNVFNVFVTYGDMFLPNTTTYDQLYYELIRTHQTFDNVFSMGLSRSYYTAKHLSECVNLTALRYTTSDGAWRDSAARLTATLANIRTITNHFSPKVDKWANANSFSSLTEDQVPFVELVRLLLIVTSASRLQVLDVVRNNYDSLTLKIQESLDQFERYAEKPRESAFFTQLVRDLPYIVLYTFRITCSV